ncbi:hypothetical protein ISN45_At01g058300 [Arabidopsis thaliana x Arabidopsis arenosa]|uniref:Uncharacterized protein n=2 Tax=Arabidopsis TaxID=3701 RepID=A0A178WJQ4_ARATH|nr:hypothetical protein ISN45_At01g058300 [Arabidopsis thaliana x Arabidopsis arenosa]OAP18476.1 hypothetical protein AXX17_AT1G61720 [Arabidopsis thaliana]
MLKRPTFPLVKQWLGFSDPLSVPRAWKKKCFKDLTDMSPYVSFFLLNLISLRSIPMALALNSGLQPIETLSAVKSQQIKERRTFHSTGLIATM